MINKVLFKNLLFALFFCATAHAQNITEYKFTSDELGWQNELVGIINNTNRTITFTTQRWIENIAQLRATFTIDGVYEVKVGATVQQSGFTTNDFRKAVIYTINDNINYTVKFISPQASGVPVIKIDTQDNAPILNREDWVTMTFSMSDANEPHNDIPVMTDQQIRGRGNSTWGNPKKPYRIRFKSGWEQSPFGLPAARNWVLLAEFQDPTFLMNVIPFELGRNIFGLPYTCSYHYVQLYLNGNYNGLYVFTEHRQADPAGIGAPGRVKVDPDEGWFVEIDSYWDEEPKFTTTNYNLPIMIKSPEKEPLEMSNPAYSFVRNDWNQLCALMASPYFPENGYRDLIDMETFIDYIMVNEIIMNGELYHPKSVFCYKDKGGKISMGPLWDHDWAFGYYGGGHTYFSNTPNSSWGTADGWFSPRHSFFKRFFADPVFYINYKQRWNEKYSEVVGMIEFIKTMGENIRNAVDEDAKRWASNGYWGGYDTNHARQVDNMISWWQRRMTWLNNEFNKLEVYPESKNFETAIYNYSDISPQIFTLVALGEIKNLTVSFEKGNSSVFELSTEIKQSENDIYSALVSVKPKSSLSAATYNDAVILSGVNQDKAFNMKLTISFTVAKGEPEYTVPAGLEANYGQRLVDINLPSGWFWTDERMSVGAPGPQTHNAFFVPEDTKNYNIVRNIEVVIMVNYTTNICETPSANSLLAWINNGVLNISGLIPGETLSIYNANGALFYQSYIASNQMNIPLNVKGVYIVRAGQRTVKLVFFD